MGVKILKAVSYTHLDVYKRQVYNLAQSFMAVNRTFFLKEYIPAHRTEIYATPNKYGTFIKTCKKGLVSSNCSEEKILLCQYSWESHWYKSLQNV